MSRRDLKLGHCGCGVEWIVTARVKVSHGRSCNCWDNFYYKHPPRHWMTSSHHSFHISSSTWGFNLTRHTINPLCLRLYNIYLSKKKYLEDAFNVVVFIIYSERISGYLKRDRGGEAVCTGDCNGNGKVSSSRPSALNTPLLQSLVWSCSSHLNPL